ncbi:MAG: hypothetical protein WC009_12080 [Methylotenera sp.]
MKNITKLILLLVLTSFMAPALAEPKMHYTHDRVRFMSGGVGHDEVVEMRKTAKRYTLNLLFSEGKVGRAVTGHNVDIYNEQDQQVFRLKNAQPVLYVNLPAGNYMVLANNNGVKLRHKFSLKENITQKIILNWKDEVEEDSLTDTE